MPNVTTLGVAAAAAAALGLAQVAFAELTDVTTLGGDFAAGNERVEGVQLTLVAWYCAMAVPLAVAVASARRSVSVETRAATVLTATAGTLATCPLLTAVSSDLLRDEVISAALTGILLGTVGGLATALVPTIGKGLTAYVALQWVAGLAFTALVPRTVVYAGMVQPLGLEFLDRLRPGMRDLPGNLDYHLPAMLPVAIAVIVLAGTVSGVFARRTGAWGPSTAAGAVGPILAAVLYRLTPEQVNLWNESASTIALWVALCSLVVAAPTAAIFRLYRANHREHADDAS